MPDILPSLTTTMQPNSAASGLILAVMLIAKAAGQVAQPEISPTEADFPTGFDAIVTCATPDAEMHYTLNGADPTKYDPPIENEESIRVNRNLVVKIKAWVGNDASTVKTATYKLTGDISGGGAHALSLAWSGTVWAWGSQSQGRLGNGLLISASMVYPTSSLYSQWEYIADGVQVAAGDNHSLLLAKDRSVWSFGGNSYGELGDGKSIDIAYAQHVQKSVTVGDYLTDCQSVSGGSNFSLALSNDGNVYAWGNPEQGRLGNGSTSGNVKYPTKIRRGDDSSYPILGDIRSISAGYSFGMARESNSQETPLSLGRVWVWGKNTEGQLGVGDSSNKTRAYPVKLNSSTPLTDAWHVAAGRYHSVIVRWKSGTPNLQGSVWTSGLQQYGRLGNNSAANSSVSYPVQVLNSSLQPLQNIETVACSGAHTIALDTTGKVWAWGYNAYGALGTGNTTNSSVAVPVKGVNGTGQLGDQTNKKIVKISAGGYDLQNFSIAIAEDGTVYTWGYNGNGQLGNGSVSTSANTLPAAASGLAILPLVPEVSISLAINENSAPGQITITSHPTHGGDFGSSLTERVDLYLNGIKINSSYGPNWTTSFGGMANGPYHLYGIAYDYLGNMAMSYPILFDIGGSAIGGPGDDPDGDGLTNSEEQDLGTDPMSASFGGTSSEQYQYDNLDRLIGVSGAKTHSFNYDASGNITESN